MNGTYEPTDEESVNPWRDDTEEEALARAVQATKINDQDKPPKPEE